jgi:hypothetical protein
VTLALEERGKTMKTFISPAVLLKLSTFCLVAGFLVGVCVGAQIL